MKLTDLIGVEVGLEKVVDQTSPADFYELYVKLPKQE